jgi:GxxExxY protein
MMVACQVIVEIKAVEALSEFHSAQLLTYLKLTGKRVGLLINFNEVVLSRGVRRMVL